ncbi:hypothetical protein PMAYCL1PPCAC_14970, partial [Pristionchus mayeri]
VDPSFHVPIPPVTLKMATEKRPIEDLSVPVNKYECELFEEEWSKIYPGELVIPWHFFPTAASKKINTKEIIGIYYRTRTRPLERRRAGVSRGPCPRSRAGGRVTRRGLRLSFPFSGTFSVYNTHYSL